MPTQQSEPPYDGFCLNPVRGGGSSVLACLGGFHAHVLYILSCMVGTRGEVVLFNGTSFLAARLEVFSGQKSRTPFFYPEMFPSSLQRENKEPKNLQIFGSSPKMGGLEIVLSGEIFFFLPPTLSYTNTHFTLIMWNRVGYDVL